MRIGHESVNKFPCKFCSKHYSMRWPLIEFH